MSGSRLLALTLLALGGIWLGINGPLEGPVLVEVTPHHGLTLADLLSLLAFVVAVWLWFDRPAASSRDD